MRADSLRATREREMRNCDVSPATIAHPRAVDSCRAHANSAPVRPSVCQSAFARARALARSQLSLLRRLRQWNCKRTDEGRRRTRCEDATRRQGQSRLASSPLVCAAKIAQAPPTAASDDCALPARLGRPTSRSGCSCPNDHRLKAAAPAVPTHFFAANGNGNKLRH